MTDLAISQLPPSSTLTGVELIPVVQNGVTDQSTVAAITQFASTETKTLTNKTISGASNTLTNIGNSSLTNSSMTIAGHVVALGGTQTLAASDLTNGTTGSGAIALSTSPSFTTPSIDAATATSINKVSITAPATGSTLTIADGKTLSVSKTLTLTGTDGTTMTFPTTSASIARTDAAQSFTGLQTFSNGFSSSTTGQVTTTFGVGGATPAASGAGVSFPAVQSASSDANTLDDYKENTFSPTIVGTSTAGTGTYGAQTGIYTKIGRVVFFRIYLSWSAHTGTGNIQINGLPFTVNSNYGAVSVWASNLALTAGNTVQGYPMVSSTSVAIEQVPTGGGTSVAIPMDTAASLMVSGFYEI